MKKYLLLALSVLVFTACTSDKEVNNNSVEFNYEAAEVVEKEDNYETSYNKGQYYTVIKDDDGKELYSYGPTSVEPVVEMLSDTLLKININDSEVVKYKVCTYYDLSAEKNSDVFTGASDETDSKVAVINDSYVEICDMFDSSAETQVIDEFSNELSATPDAILSAEFSEDGSEVTVKYCTGDDLDEVNETFKVN